MNTLFERFSSKENLRQAYKYVQYELTHSSLSVNPINHAALTAIDALGERFFVALERYLRDGKYVPERGFFVYIPKDNLGLRPVCILSMTDRIIYQAMFNQNILGHKVDGQLSDKICFANRVSDNETSRSFLSPYFNGWDDFCKAQKKAFEKGFVWKSEIDVQQYYEHIPVGSLVEKLRGEFGIKDEKLLDILKAQLCTWAEYPELPKGIPQGPDSSAVLGNAYLSSLDKFAEAELIGKELRYLRYADDITLMGRNKENVLKATEKIVRFLRNYNLNLNEKTKLSELQNTEEIEALRIASDYDDSNPEIPEDQFTRIQEKVPAIIRAIIDGERVEKLELRELKYYLKVGTGYNLDFIQNLISIIPLRPSLVVPIIKYVSDGRGVLQLFGNSTDTLLIDYALWEIYNHAEISEWSKFWTLKLLISNEDMRIAGVEDEMERILASKEATIFSVVGFYYKAIRGQKIEIDVVKRAITESTTDVEKALYSFFLLNAFDGARIPVIRECIEKTLNASSLELNLIGCYLYQSNPKAAIEDTDGLFSAYILKKRVGARKLRANNKTAAVQSPEYYIIPSKALTPFTTPMSDILGVSRNRLVRHSIEIKLPEIARWEKIELKVKEGLQEIEIFYNGRFIQKADYIQLGFFSGKKHQKPDRQWGFLCALSVLSATDIKQATADKMRNMVAVNSGVSLSTGNVHQIKRTLVKRLRAIFKTDVDPFHNRRDYYLPKFTVLPEPDLRRAEIWTQGGRLNENRRYDETDTDK